MCTAICSVFGPIEVFDNSEILLVEKAVHGRVQVEPCHRHLREGSHHRPLFDHGVGQWCQFMASTTTALVCICSMTLQLEVELFTSFVVNNLNEPLYGE